MSRLIFPGPGAQLLIILKLVRLHLPPKRSGISPHPQALYLWKPSSFLDRRAERVWTVETMAAMRWKMTWSRQVKAWAEDGEVWVVISPVYPSPAGHQLGQAGWWEVSS